MSSWSRIRASDCWSIVPPVSLAISSIATTTSGVASPSEIEPRNVPRIWLSVLADASHHRSRVLNELPVVACPACGKKNRLPEAKDGTTPRCGSCKEGLLDQPVELSDRTFDWLAAAPKAVVDFWAPWCGPCVQFSPLFQESARSNSGVVHAKVNVDDNPSTARRFHVSGIPTMVMLRSGVEVDRIVGAVNGGTLQSALRKLAE